MLSRLVSASAAVLLLTLVIPLASGGYEGSEEQAAATRENPCTGPQGPKLRCPDLQMRRPYDLTVERTPKGRVLLRAASAIKSRGRGPIEIHGVRTARREMRVR